jgi:hypothetical protein
MSLEYYCYGAAGAAGLLIGDELAGTCSATSIGRLGWLANNARIKQFRINAVANIAVVLVKKSVFPRTEKSDPVD